MTVTAEKEKTLTPTRYKAKFIEPGIISYEDSGAGKVFVSKEALDKMMASFVGKPVVNKVHKDLLPQEAFKTSDTNPTSAADGIVSNVEFDPETGWYWADMLVWDLATKENLDKNGYTVSCAYVPTDVGGPGTYHNIDYDDEVLNGNYTHMAIVANPRYEGAEVIRNSKGGRKVVFTFSRKKKAKELKNTEAVATDDKNTDDAIEANADDSYIIDEDGNKIPVSEMMAAYKAKCESEAGTVMNMDDEVDLGNGEKATVKDMYEAYKAGKQNETPTPTGTEAEEVVDESKQNSVPKKPAPQKPNANFKKLHNAANEGEEIKPNVKTRAQRLALGKERYGALVANKGDK